MSLVADYDSDSDSSVSSVENDPTIKTEIKVESVHNGNETKLPVPVFKLPTPKFSGETNPDNPGSPTSVFINPFLEAENAKEAILQKHVKMVNTKDAVIINGKKICWNYRKGRCRFGHNCKYAHDSDLQKTQEQLNAELEVTKARSVVCQFRGSNSSLNLHSTPPPSEEFDADKEETDLSINKTGKKRKRPGLTQGLIPGKKVMKQYMHHKS